MLQRQDDILSHGVMHDSFISPQAGLAAARVMVFPHFLVGNMSLGMAEAGRVFSLLRLVWVDISLIMPLIWGWEANTLISWLCLVTAFISVHGTLMLFSARHPASLGYSHSPKVSWFFKASGCWANTVECLWCLRDGKGDLLFKSNPDNRYHLKMAPGSNTLGSSLEMMWYPFPK